MMTVFIVRCCKINGITRGHPSDRPVPAQTDEYINQRAPICCNFFFSFFHIFFCLLFFLLLLIFSTHLSIVHSSPSSLKWCRGWTYLQLTTLINSDNVTYLLKFNPEGIDLFFFFFSLQKCLLWLSRGGNCWENEERWSVLESQSIHLSADNRKPYRD